MTGSFVYDPSGEWRNYTIPGLQHKYRETALLFVSQDCHSTCEWCFRKRLFEGQALKDDCIVDPDEALRYIRAHQEIHSVLLSGGDALLADPALVNMLYSEICKIDHVHNIRIGTRAIVHKPEMYRDRLPVISCKKVYVVLHIVRPAEVRPGLRDIVQSFPQYSFFVQTPLLRNINNDPETMADLWYSCAEIRLHPYYVFQCRPARGNEKFCLTLGEGLEVLAGAHSITTGVVKTPRYVMSNRTGKWEIVGLDQKDVILRCHQGISADMVGCLRRASPHTIWWDLPKDDPMLDGIPLHRSYSAGND